MAITVSDLKFYKSERMTDNSDGGGQMTANEIVSGVDNAIFDDLSDVDRAAGDVSIRKVYAAVTSPDTDKYLDAGVVIFREPADENVSVLACSTEDFYDERDAIKNRLEQTISRGARWNGWLWGPHLTGQRALVIWQRMEAELPSTGHRLEVVAKSGSVEQYSQFLWITRVTEETRTMYDEKGTYSIRSVTCELAEALEANYTGSEPDRYDPSATSATALLYDTRYNAEAVPLYGIRPTVAEGGVGDFTVQVDDLYSPVIPTAFAETALPDVTPGSDSAALIAGRDTGTISFSTTTQCVKPDASLYLGSACTPGTLTISVSGSTLTDDNGEIKLAGTTVVGAINYAQGVASFTSACSNYGTATKTITFRPAAIPLRVADTASQAVTAENRGYVWVLTLSPIPAPKTLRVSYRVNNAWYTVSDLGGGTLAGSDSSYGSGRLDFATGTVTLTTGALPDVDSEIMYVWGTPVSYTARGGDAVDAPVVRGTTAHAGVAPGTVVVSWTVGQTTYTLDDSPAANGLLTGTGGSGAINYSTGEWWVRPTTIPASGQEFHVDYDWGTPIEETFEHPARDGNGDITLELANTNVLARSVEVEFNLLIEEYDPVLTTTWEMIRPPTVRVDPIQIVRDDGAGGIELSDVGGTDGSINYSAGTLTFKPDVTLSVPRAVYEQNPIGTRQETHNGAVYEITTYRTLFKEWEYIPSGAAMPTDTSGWVKVRYRVSGGNTSATETVTLDALNLDLTRGYGEYISRNSARFRIGTDVFVDTNGQIYLNPEPDTGAGTLAGSLDPTTGRCYISSWTGGITNAVTLDSLVTEVGGQPVEEVVFRTPVSPIKSGTLQLRFNLLDGTAKSKTVGGSGLLEDADCKIVVDYPLGIVRARFGLWKLDADLTPSEKLEPWYSPDYRVTMNGQLYIWKPKLVAADSIIYNAVAQTFLPPDSDLLGLNAARMPPDGKALIFNTGRLVLVHHTDLVSVQSLSPDQVVDCSRTRLYRAVVEDSLGARLDPSQYTLDRVAGTLTMSPSLDTQGFTPPWSVYHTVADLARLTAVDINGTLSLQRPLSHIYPADDSRVSGVLFAGTLQARYSNLFAQSSWTGEWSDELIGSEPLCQYNDTLYPIGVANLGAYPDRFLIKFTSSTAFQVIGENLGLISTGDINTDCEPENSLTGQPYFTIDHRGWGAGWSTGNCLRFNLLGAVFPVDLVRAVQPSTATGLSDSIELLFVGNVDA